MTTGHTRDHAEQHGIGGLDPLDPVSIGAATQTALNETAVNLMSLIAVKADLPLVDVIEQRVSDIEIVLPLKAEQVAVNVLTQQVNGLAVVPKEGLVVLEALTPVPEGWEQAGQLPPFLLIRKKQIT